MSESTRLAGTDRAQVRTVAVFVLAVIAAAAGDARSAEDVWLAPAEWTEIGTVAAWRAADARFYRHRAGMTPLDRSRDHLDQAAIYVRTTRHRSPYPPVDLATWARFDDEARDARRAAARRELGFVRTFHQRILSEVQNTRANIPAAWGTRISDHTVVGDMIGRLRTAVGLAPENPYAWHLYSYFATVIGDTERARRALDGAAAALAALPESALTELRAAVALDWAWLLREQGAFTAAGEALAAAVAEGARGAETRLLQGLLAAQTGDDLKAIAAAADLRSTAVADFPLDYRGPGISPEVTNTAAWARKPSSYLHDWIMAWTWLRAGRPDLARAAFGTFDVDDQRPFADRFWNEAGEIYLATGRPNMAAAAWEMARICVPYQPYLVSKDYGGDLRNLTGRIGRVPFQLGFDTHYLNGSRLAWITDLVSALAATSDEHERRRLAARALDELEVCRRFGLFAGQAAILQGQVYHLMGDDQSAMLAVEEALTLLDAAGDRTAFAAVLSGLGRSRDELAPQDIAHFYGQSGKSRSRWLAIDDPAGDLQRLRRAYQIEPGDDTRRALARFLIRHGDIQAGRELAMKPLADEAPTETDLASLPAADITLVLEADRAAGDVAVAAALVELLEAGRADPWSDAGVWALAGSVCLDQGLRAAGRLAIERAVELDPGNRGLKLQLSLL